MRQQDYYELLGVRRDASFPEIRRAYELSLQRANRDGGTRHMVDLVKAYEVLGDPGRRQVYDQTGLGVVPERVPNTFGRAVPWRGGHGGLGQRRSSAGVSGQHVLPSQPPSKSAWPKVAATSAAVVVVLVSVAAGLHQWSTGTVAPTASIVVPRNAPVGADGLANVVCQPDAAGHVYSFRAPRGQLVTCPSGGKPHVDGTP